MVMVIVHQKTVHAVNVKPILLASVQVEELNVNYEGTIILIWGDNDEGKKVDVLNPMDIFVGLSTLF